jgi:hypothetical protein
MQRSSKDSWLGGPGDLAEAEVEDVPIAGESVKVRALSAKYSAEVQGQLKLVTEGREQIAKIDVPTMELLQFQHGVIEPQFSRAEAEQIQERYGIDKEAIEKVEQTFPAGSGGEEGSDVGNGVAPGDRGSDLHVRTGA